MNVEFPKVRLHVDEPLAEGASLTLAESQSHYVGRVMRMREGDALALFNGTDGEWRGAIRTVARNAVSLRVETMLRPQAPEPDLWLAFAPVKRLRIDYLVAKATELGASALWPLFTRRTAVERVKLERLAANAVEAAEQCGRLTVPRVFEPARLEDAIARWPAERHLLLLDETGGPPAVDALLRIRAERPAVRTAPWAVLCGPEGGFTRSELDVIGNLSFVTRVGLGPRILRAETAALAALTCWQAVLGDWGESPPRSGS
ncbi:MAG: 16S rRNA (uracil(1498)-N(3))-methyltransferase [Acetobacterales bacterium]